MASERSILSAMLRHKCPECKKGDVFCQKGIFPLSSLLRMHKQCPECGAKLIGETNNGPGINFVLTTLLLFLNALWYAPVFGLSYLDNSIFYFLGTSVLIVLLLQPYLLRWSRIIYLYIWLGIKG